MRRWCIWFAILAFLITPARAEEISEDFIDALPQEISQLYETGDDLVGEGFATLFDRMMAVLAETLRSNVRAAVLLVLVSLLCGLAQGFGAALGPEGGRFVPAVGALAVTSIASGDFTVLIGAGAAAMEELGIFAKVLLPTMAAAMAGGGFAATAGLWQVATLFVSEFLLRLIRELLLPATYCYIGLVTAGALLPDSRLDLFAMGIKKLLAWALCGIMTLFTMFLTVSNVLSGSADKTAVKLTKSVISGAVPVVGSILSETTEAVLSAASSLRAVIGILGILSVLAVCLTPLVHLSVQFLLYKAAAFLSAVAGTKTLNVLIEQLGDAFGLVLGMTACCALVLMVAILVSITMVVM